MFDRKSRFVKVENLKSGIFHQCSPPLSLSLPPSPSTPPPSLSFPPSLPSCLTLSSAATQMGLMFHLFARWFGCDCLTNWILKESVLYPACTAAACPWLQPHDHEPQDSSIWHHLVAAPSFIRCWMNMKGNKSNIIFISQTERVCMSVHECFSGGVCGHRRRGGLGGQRKNTQKSVGDRRDREWGGGWMSEREGGKRMKHCGRDGERRGRDAAFLVVAATAGADRGMEGIDEKGRN